MSFTLSQTTKRTPSSSFCRLFLSGQVVAYRRVLVTILLTIQLTIQLSVFRLVTATIDGRSTTWIGGRPKSDAAEAYLESHLQGKLPTQYDDYHEQFDQHNHHSRAVQSIVASSFLSFLRIDCGNLTTDIGGFVDSRTHERWMRDMYFASKSGVPVNVCSDSSKRPAEFNPITTPHYQMYCTHRLGPRRKKRLFQWGRNKDDGVLTYNIPVQIGVQYYLRLYFMEPSFQQPGQRVSNIRIEGRIVRSSLDYYTEFGFFTPGSLTFGPILAANPIMTIQLVPVKNRPIIAGIDISSKTGSFPIPKITSAPITKSSSYSPIKSPAKSPVEVPGTSPSTSGTLVPSLSLSTLHTTPPTTQFPTVPAFPSVTITPLSFPTSNIGPTERLFNTPTLPPPTPPADNSTNAPINIRPVTISATPFSAPSTKPLVALSPTSVITPSLTPINVPSMIPLMTSTTTPVLITMTPVSTPITPVVSPSTTLIRRSSSIPSYEPSLTPERPYPTSPKSAPSTMPAVVPLTTPVITPSATPVITTTAAPGIVTTAAPVMTTSPTFEPSRTPGILQFRTLSTPPTASLININTDAPINTIITSPSSAPFVSPNTASFPLYTPTMTSYAPTLPVVYATLPLKINIGYGDNYTDSFGKIWTPEQYLVDPIGMSTIFSADAGQFIFGTFDDLLYRNVRQGSSFGYEIPLPVGRYEVVLYMCELFYNQTGERIFNVQVENEAIEMLDMLASGGKKFTKYTLEFIKVVDDGKLSIYLTSPQNVSISTGLPVLAGISVNLVGEHLAHAVSNGPYTAIDRLDIGYAMVPVDASNSHTHGEEMTLTSVVWTEGNVVIGTNLTMEFNMSVGEHEVTLTVADSGGTTSSDQTTITVHSFGHPSITNVSPDVGSLGGGENITLTGSGFIFPLNMTSVRFGDILLEGSSGAVFIENRTTIHVVAPPSLTSQIVTITVITPRGESTETARFKYDVPRLPVMFDTGLLQADVLTKPTACAFGPDKKLYVGNSFGRLIRFDVDFTGPTPKSTPDIVLTVLTKGYLIMGIAFDPAETNILEPMIYFSNCDYFHLEKYSSSGLAINGRISRMKVTRTSPTTFTFTDLVHIITGLPISDHDHGFNAIVFGNHGELYMVNGGNTNGGRPGSLSTTGLQKDGYLSASVVVANVSHPNFNGAITYTAPDDGDMVDRTHIDVFAHGLRNPFGLTIHSNGKLYATDNGPNAQYGAMTTGCGPNDFIPGATDPDKVLLVEKGKYYGFPNLKRAAVLNEPHQCVYLAPDTTPTDSNKYTPPLAIMPSALGSVFEYTADYFDGQLRGNLIVAKFGDELWKVVLTSDGTEAVAASKGGISLGLGDNNLLTAQAPDGTIIAIRYATGELAYHKPVEPASTALKVYSVFPVRGTSVGMYFVSIYGLNFENSTSTTSITVGGLPCLTQIFVSSGQIDCQLAGGVPGLVDIAVEKTGTGERVVLTQAFRYISGFQL